MVVVLHPRHKLEYFKKAAWETKWVESAENILRNEYDRTYRFRDGADINVQDAATVCNYIDISSMTYSCRTFVPFPQPGSPVKSKNIFDHLPAFTSLSTNISGDEITRYLSTGPENVKNKDLLAWWYEHKHIYPHLYRMALDYHTIPCK